MSDGHNVWDVENELTVESPKYIQPVMTADEFAKIINIRKMEKEFGIDMETFAKIVTARVLYIKNVPYDNEIKMVFLTKIQRATVPNVHYLVWLEDAKDESLHYMYHLEDYGKKLAITREELK